MTPFHSHPLRLSALALGLGAVLSLIPSPGQAGVYIGGSGWLVNGFSGGYTGYIDGYAGWPYVRTYASGFYTTTFTVDGTTPSNNGFLTTMKNLMANDNVFYETDMPHRSDFSDKVVIDVLRSYGWNVVEATCNSGMTASRNTALNWRAARPVLAMAAPWQISGTMSSANGIQWQSWIGYCNGSATDGPMGHWINNVGSMKQGSVAGVAYTRSRGKRAMVMLAPYTLGGDSSRLLSVGQDCVRYHENANQAPHDWVVSYYASDLQRYTVTPEKNASNQPLSTITGLAYWLIRHVQGSAGFAAGPMEDAVRRVAKGGMDLVVPVRNGNATCSFPVRLAHQDADWLDLCPVIRAEVKDPSGSWDVKVSLHGQDVTRELTETGGVNCVGPLRLWSGQAHDLQVTLSGRPEARVPNGPVEVKFTAITHSSEPDRVSDTFTVRATAATAESGVASR